MHKTNPDCDCGVDTSLVSRAVQDDLLNDIKKKTHVLHSLRPPGVLSRAAPILHLRYGFND